MEFSTAIERNCCNCNIHYLKAIGSPARVPQDSSYPPGPNSTTFSLKIAPQWLKEYFLNCFFNVKIRIHGGS